MIEFFFGMFVGILAAVLPLFSGWLTKQEYSMVNELESNDFDYTKVEKSLEEKVDSPFDPENYFKNFKREGTK
tara:strand:- start:152 stop:370 length:219 start_codon:yes stop_codon:yes gene_type:complete